MRGHFVSSLFRMAYVAGIRQYRHGFGYARSATMTGETLTLVFKEVSGVVPGARVCADSRQKTKTKT